jgi:7-cyano-7-deazaguanine synthase
MLLLLIGASYAYSINADAVAIGLLHPASALFPDQTPDFLRLAQTAVNEALGEIIEVVAPLMTMTKADVMRIANDLGIFGTYSCHIGEATPCGQCISCKENAHAVSQIREV